MQLIGETELSEFVIKALKDASQSKEQRIEGWINYVCLIIQDHEQFLL